MDLKRYTKLIEALNDFNEPYRISINLYEEVLGKKMDIELTSVLVADQDDVKRLSFDINSFIWDFQSKVMNNGGCVSKFINGRMVAEKFVKEEFNITEPIAIKLAIDTISICQGFNEEDFNIFKLITKFSKQIIE